LAHIYGAIVGIICTTGAIQKWYVEALTIDTSVISALVVVRIAKGTRVGQMHTHARITHVVGTEISIRNACCTIFQHRVEARAPLAGIYRTEISVLNTIIAILCWGVDAGT